MKPQTWPTVALGSRTQFLSGGTPSKSEDRYWNGDIPWIGSGEMSEQRIHKTTHSVTHDGAQNGTRVVPRNTVLMVVRGMSLAKECRVSLTTRESTFNQDVKALNLSPNVDPGFVFYYLRSQRFTLSDAASEAAHGTKKLDTPVLEQWPFPDVPLPTQRKIAAILTAYDDLIETNKRRITVLEKMAEELYREWFVRMRFPGHQDTKFVKGVPKGWAPQRMGNLIEHYIGGGWGEGNPTPKFSDSAFVIRGTDIPMVQIGALSSIPFRFHTPSNLKSRVMRPNDFVFEASGGSKNQLLGRNVRVSGVILDSLLEPVIPASFCKLIRFDRRRVSPFLMQQYLKLFYDQGLVGIFQVQSTGISNYQFESFLKYHKMLTPPDSLQEQFEAAVKPMLDLKDRIGLENSVAVHTRDFLLPRLISGKLPVEDLDIQFPPSMREKATDPAHA